MNQGNGVRTVPSHEEVERAIRSVPGVAEASVARAVDTGRGRLRIRLHPGEDPDRVSWSVAATLRERFGIALDPTEIRPRLTASPEAERVDGHLGLDVETTTDGQSDAGTVTGPPGQHRVEDPVLVLDGATDGQPGAEGHDGAARAPSLRPVIRDLGSRNDGVALTVTATLEFGGRLTAGEAQGNPTTRGLHRAIAEATLSALGQLTSLPLRAQVDRVTVGEADPAAAQVVVSLLSDRGEELLLGASIVRGDVEHAVMRAALDAVNRRVERDLVFEFSAP